MLIPTYFVEESHKAIIIGAKGDNPISMELREIIILER